MDIKNNRLFLIFGLFLVILLLPVSAQDTQSIRFHSSNFDYLAPNSDLILLPYDDWSMIGTWSYYGLPDFTTSHYYNGMRVRDPLFGNQPVNWLNVRNSLVNYQKNKINVNSIQFQKKKLFTKFNYYQGDYSFKLFDLIVGQKFSEKFSWTFYGKNIGYDGGYGLYGPYFTNGGESVSQSYHLDCFFQIGEWESMAGIGYNKFRPGLLNYSENYYSPEEQYLQWNHQSYMNEWKINNYIRFERQTADSTYLGFNIANYFYRSNYSDFPLKAEGRSMSAKFQRYFYAGETRFQVRIEPLIQTAYYKYHESQNQSVVTSKINYADSVFQGDLNFSLGAANLTPLYTLNYQKNLLKKLAVGLEIKNQYNFYPLAYFAPQEWNKEKLNDEHFISNHYSASLQYHGENLNNELKISHQQASFQIPFQNSPNDSLIKFQEVELPSLYIFDNFKLELPWQGQLSGKIIFTPEDDDNFLQLQGFASYRQYLSPVLEFTAGVFPDWLGFFQYYFNQLAENMTPYLAVNSSYLQGGNNIFWFQEFQNLGKTATNYFTNKRVNINFRVGFRVDTFHFFFAMYNAEGRQFSSVSGMPFRNRLQVLGVEWSFMN